MPASSRSFCQITIALLLAFLLPSSAHAADQIWKVVVSESNFGPGENTLVIKRASKASAEESAKMISQENGRFLFVSGGSVYLVVDQQTPTPLGTTSTTDVARWPHMKLIKIGQRPFRVYCYRCFQDWYGLRDDRITLSFLAAIDPRLWIPETVVFNTR